MSDNGIWRLAKKWGHRFQTLEKQQQAAANQLARQGEVGRPPSKSAVPMGVGMDGASIYIRQEGWKELKAGCVFNIELRRVFDPEAGSVWSKATRLTTAISLIWGTGTVWPTALGRRLAARLGATV